jgi:hypothetical protein
VINDYATLQAKVAQYLARADLTAVIPDFIQLAESRMNLDLALSPQQLSASGTSAGGVITPPATIRQIQSLLISIDGVQREIYPVPPSQGGNANLIVLPIGYTVVNGVVHLVGSADTDYVMTYYAGIPSLSTDAGSTQNWLILLAPQLYLYATLLEASVYLRDDQRTALFGQGYSTALDGLRRQDEMLRYGPSPRPRVDFIAP